MMHRVSARGGDMDSIILGGLEMRGPAAAAVDAGLVEGAANGGLRPARELGQLPDRAAVLILLGAERDQPRTLLRRLVRRGGADELRQHLEHGATRVRHVEPPSSLSI